MRLAVEWIEFIKQMIDAIPVDIKYKYVILIPIQRAF